MNQTEHKDLQRINKTAHYSYQYEGAGVGADASAIDVLEQRAGITLERGSAVLEIGVGQGLLLDRALNEYACSLVVGADIAPACFDTQLMRNKLLSDQRLKTYLMDASHETIPEPDNSIDYAFCTETIEHLSNPYHMFAEVKRVLKHGGYFTLSFPMPEDNLGYGGGQHAHVYPGFLVKESWDVFVKQLYFKSVHEHMNGSSRWCVLKNYKGEGVTDVFSMTSANYDESKLFACLENF